METSASTITKILFIVCGIAFAFPSLFFIFYTVLLIYKNVSAPAEEAAVHRTGGMLIGAIAFPLAAIFFGFISLYFFRRTGRGPTNNERKN